MRKVVKEHVQGAAGDAAVPRRQKCAPDSGPFKPRVSAASMSRELEEGCTNLNDPEYILKAAFVSMIEIILEENMAPFQVPLFQPTVNDAASKLPLMLLVMHLTSPALSPLAK